MSKSGIPGSSIPDSGTPARKTDATEALLEAARQAPYAKKMGLRCLKVEPGFSRVEMIVTEDMLNSLGMAHGGVLYGLLEETFQLACNAHGVTALALNLSVTCLNDARAGDRIVAEARELSLTKRTGTYEVRVTREGGDLLALAQALAHRRASVPPSTGE